MILPGINSQTIAQMQRMAFRSSPDQASDVNRNRENETHLKFHHKGRTQRGRVSRSGKSAAKPSLKSRSRTTLMPLGFPATPK
jgi:hypothetical protein